MSEAAWVALGGLGTAFVTGLTGWFGARKKYSGQIESTEASQLWAEQADYRDRLQKRVSDLELALSHEKLRREFGELRHRVTVHSLRNEIMRLSFLAHPDIPDEVKTQMLGRQTDHVAELEKELREMKTSLLAEGIVV